MRLAQIGIEVRMHFGHLLTAGAFEAMEVDHDDVTQVLNAAVSEHL